MRKFHIILTIVAIIGLIQGYVVANMNEQRKLDDAYRLIKEHHFEHKNEIDKLINEENIDGAFKYVEKIESEYNELYGNE